MQRDLPGLANTSGVLPLFSLSNGTLPRDAEPEIIAAPNAARKHLRVPFSMRRKRRRAGTGRPFAGRSGGHSGRPSHSRPAEARRAGTYLLILETTPAPTVRPPSRIAKRRPSSIATGLISVTLIFTLSPGITISTPSGSCTAPVMSVVRK